MGERPPQYSISCLVSEETSIKSPSAKNSDNVMPKPLQMDSNVPMEGSEFRFRIVAIVFSDRPQLLDKR